MATHGSSPFAALVDAGRRSAAQQVQRTPAGQVDLATSRSRIRRLPMNQRGRDFIVGDIHGAYDLVLEAMRLVSFDADRDRLFAVGDLIDRGPESWRVARFLAQPFVHSVQGNHDHNFAELYGDGDPDEAVLEVLSRMFGMQWIEATPPEDRRAIAQALARLPVVIEVQTQRGLVGIVHGDVPGGWGWKRFVDAVERGDRFALETALEGRRRIESEDQSGVGGVGRVFVGHTPQRDGPKRYGNVYAVDTGAIFNVLMDKQHYGLTMANLTTATAPLVNRGDQGMARVLVIDQAGSEEPFGLYATGAEATQDDGVEPATWRAR